MSGKNKLIIDTAKMIEIVQYWVDTNKVYPAGAAAPLITDVAGSKDGRTFAVTLHGEPVKI